MSENERFLIATIIGILLGTSDDPAIERDLKYAAERAGMSPEFLLSVARELEGKAL